MSDEPKNPKHPYSGLTAAETDELEAAGWSEVLVETCPYLTSTWRHPDVKFDKMPADALAIVRATKDTSAVKCVKMAATIAYELRRLGWRDDELDSFAGTSAERIDEIISAIDDCHAHRLSVQYRTLLVEALTALRDGRYDTGERDRLDAFTRNPPPAPLDIEATFGKIAETIERKTKAKAEFVVYRTASAWYAQANSNGTTQFSGNGISLEAAVLSLSRSVVERTVAEAQRLKFDAEALAASVAGLPR